MSTYSHPLRPIHINRITLASPDSTVSLETEQEELVAPPDDGLGCLRGLGRRHALLRHFRFNDRRRLGTLAPLALATVDCHPALSATKGKGLFLLLHRISSEHGELRFPGRPLR